MSAGYARTLPALCLLSLCTPAMAQTAPEGLSASGSVRLRYEAIDNQPRAGFDAADSLVNLRTQLKLVWKHEDIRLVTEIYDSRAWGADPGTPLSTGEVNALEPVQAYLEADLGPALGKGTSTSLQVGRFALNFGSRRLLASDDYRNTTNGFTGAKADFAFPGGVKASAVYVLPQTRLPDSAADLRDHTVRLDRESSAARLWGGLVLRRKPGSAVLAEASFLRFDEEDRPGRPTRDRGLANLGLRVLADPRPGAFDWGAEGIYQWGRVSASTAPAAARLKARASFVRLHAGYTFTHPWKPRVLLELDRASGEGPGATYRRFDPLFGMRRADLGPAGLYNSIGRANIASPGLRVEAAPSKRLDAFLGYRARWRANRHDAFSTTGLRDATGRSGAFAGHQIDLRLRRWLVPARLNFEFDGTLLARGRFLRDAPGGRGGTARYASFNLTGYF